MTRANAKQKRMGQSEPKTRHWSLSDGIRVEAHPYDDTLYAFEVVRQKRCLGTIIPKTESEMKELESRFDQDLPIDGIPCNDEYRTVITVNPSK